MRIQDPSQGGQSPSPAVQADRAKKLLDRAFAAFLAADVANILSGVSERNLCGRLALAMERELPGLGLEGYHADTEYNRNGRSVKTILDGKYRIVTVVCDLIVHSRGASLAHDNVLAVEMKKRGRPEHEAAADRQRLRALTKASYDEIWSNDGTTLPEHVCGYELGAFIELDARARSYRIEEFRGGLPIGITEGGF